MVLLCEGPKPNISMISGFLSPGGRTLVYGLKYTNIRQKIEEMWKHLLNNMFVNMGIVFLDLFDSLCTVFCMILHARFFV